MNIYGYDNNGIVCGRDTFQWTASDTNNNQGVVLSNTLPTGYIDISAIETWENYGYRAVDYLIINKEIKDLVQSKGWINLSTIEKQIAIDYYAHSNGSDKVTFLMEQGESYTNSIQYLFESWHKHNLALIKACKQRWDYAKIIVPMYLSFIDANIILSQIESLILSYTNEGLFGIDYGDTTSGIINYIEDTYDFTNSGLASNSFTYTNGGTLQIVIAALKDILVNGNYKLYL